MNHIGRAGYVAFTKLYTTELVDVSVFANPHLGWKELVKRWRPTMNKHLREIEENFE